MSEYTPTTNDMREFYQGQLVKVDDDVYEFADEEKSNAEFDRWLAAHNAKVRNAALEEAAVIADDRLHPDDPHCEVCRIVAAIRAKKGIVE